MNINDVRIGNIFQDSMGIQIVVDKIFSEDGQWWVQYSYSDTKQFILVKDLWDIPITKDILIGFGYHETKPNHYHKIGSAIDFNLRHINTQLIEIGGNEYDCNYIHKLQNIAWSLFGEEFCQLTHYVKDKA